MDACALSGMYRDWDAFSRFRGRVDPRGLFHNDWTALAFSGIAVPDQSLRYLHGRLVGLDRAKKGIDLFKRQDFNNAFNNAAARRNQGEAKEEEEGNEGGGAPLSEGQS